MRINIATFTSLKDLIADLLSNEHDEEEILSAIQDVDLRFAWKCHDRCRVLSRSMQQWTDGEIVDIVIDGATNKEWLTVKYGNQKKQIQRFSSGLIPIEMDNDYRCNEVIIERILERVKGSENGDDRKQSISLVLWSFFRVISE